MVHNQTYCIIVKVIADYDYDCIAYGNGDHDYDYLKSIAIDYNRLQSITITQTLVRVSNKTGALDWGNPGRFSKGIILE